MARNKKDRLPKRLVGVKIPKDLRKGKFGRFIGSPAGQASLTEAVLLLGTAFAAKQTAKAAKTDAPSTDTSVEVADMAAPERLSQAISAAAVAFQDALKAPAPVKAPKVKAAAAKKSADAAEKPALPH